MENLEKTRHVEILESETMTWLVKMSRNFSEKIRKERKEKNPKRLDKPVEEEKSVW